MELAHHDVVFSESRLALHTHLRALLAVPSNALTPPSTPLGPGAGAGAAAAGAAGAGCSAGGAVPAGGGGGGSSGGGAVAAETSRPQGSRGGGENDGFAAAARTSEGKLRAASYELRAPGTRGAAQRPRRGAAECMSAGRHAGIHRVRVPSGKPRAALHGSHGPWDLWDL